MKKTMKLVSLTLALLMLVACAAACGGGSGGGSETAKKVLNICMGSDYATLNAHAVADNIGTVYDYCGAYLWRSFPGNTAEFTDAGYHYYGDLADGLPKVVKTETGSYTQYEAVQDANGNTTGEYTSKLVEDVTLQTWEFSIREEAKWNNGDKITAEEIVWSWEQLAKPELANAMSDFLCYNITILNVDAYRWGQVTWDQVGIKAEGNKITITTIGEPSLKDFVSNFYDRSLSPVKKDIYEKGLSTGTSEWGTSLENWMSCGPYKFDSWTVDSVQTYVKNPDHWLADKFHYDVVNLKIVPEMNSRVQMFESGQLDTLAPDASTIDQYLDDPRMTVYGSTTVYHIDINCLNTNNPLCLASNPNQLDYRKALYHAMDRETIAFELFGQQQAAGTYVNLQAGLLSESGQTYRESTYGQAVTDMVKSWSEEGHTTGYNRAKAVEYMKKAFEGAGMNWDDASKQTLKLTLDISDKSWNDTAAFLNEEFPKIFVNDAGNVKVDIEIVPQGSISSTEMKKEGSGFGPTGWDLSPNDWSRGASRQDPYVCFYYYTDQYSSPPNNFFSTAFNDQYRVCQDTESKSYDEQLAACKKLEEIYLETVIQCPIAQVVNYEMFAEKLVLPTEDYIPGYGWGLMYGDIVEAK